MMHFHHHLHHRLALRMKALRTPPSRATPQHVIEHVTVTKQQQTVATQMPSHRMHVIAAIHHTATNHLTPATHRCLPAAVVVCANGFC